MRLDIGPALDEAATPGVPRAALDRLDRRVGTAHERIAAGREAGEFGYAALNPPDTADVAAVRDAAAAFDDPAAVLTVGIGGSALGAATLTAALDGDVPHHVLDNVDPAATRSLLDSLPLDRTVVHAVSRSGTTAETLANFLVVREAMRDAGVDWTDRTVVTTGESGNLRRLANRHDLPVLDAPEGVPGRFAALSTVGLVPAAVRGHDLDALLAGAGDAADALGPSLFDCPAYAYGATCYALAARGASMNAMLPYAEGLETFAEWFAQLWAESLGKDGLGQTPLRALGATDQHSQLQLYRAGPRDKVVTVVGVEDRPDVPIPDPESVSGLDYLAGESLGSLLDAERRATAASLAAADRPHVRLTLSRLDERAVGELLYAVEAACVLYGELAGVETFTQPAVEWGKRAARGLLGADEGADASVGDAPSLEVE